MTEIEVTDELLGDLGELYFKHLCYQRGYAFVRLDNVHKTLPNQVIDFKFEFERIPIRIPDELVPEVSRISKPTPINGTQSFVFDFLTCRVYEADKVDKPNARDSRDFCWVEIKTGKSSLSRHQEEVARTCEMRFSVFRVVNAMSPPDEVEIEWEFDSRRE